MARPLQSSVAGGLQLAISVLLGLYLGRLLDEKWDLSPWMMLAGAALGLGVGLYSFLKPYFSRASHK